MKIVKMDRKFAEAIIRSNCEEGINFEFEYCEKCGAIYMPEHGHNCENVIGVPVYEKGDEEWEW